MKNDSQHPFCGSLSEQYHVGSRNRTSFSGNRQAHFVHYAPEIQQMVQQAGLHIDTQMRVRLPKLADGHMTLTNAIVSRKSRRDFHPASITPDALATVLYLGNGVRSSADRNKPPQRNTPTSGNLGSVEVFPIIRAVDTVPPGIYHYDTIEHDLAQIRPGDFSRWLGWKVFFQKEYSSAAVVLVLVASIERLTIKYGERGYRLALLDVGHVSQNLLLAATAQNLSSAPAAGFVDDELDAALKIDGITFASMLAIAIGRPNQSGCNL